MPLELEVQIGSTWYKLKQVIGKATSGNEIDNLPEQPSEVRIFSPSKPYGEVDNGTYNSTTNKYTLSRTLSSGEVAVAFKGEKFLFEDILSKGGLPGFVTNTASENDRTKEQVVRVRNSEQNLRYLNVKLTKFEKIVEPASGPEISWFKVKNQSDSTWIQATDLATTPLLITTPATDTSQDSIGPGQSRNIVIQCVASQNLNTNNFRNIQFTIESIEQDIR